MERISIRVGKLIWFLFLFLGRKINRLQKNTITIGGFRYVYLSPATIDPELDTLILLHGFTGFKEYWAEFMWSCTKRLNFIVLDLPGHGESAFDQEGDFREQALALVHGVVIQNNLKNIHLVGASLGAWVACEFALEHPACALTLSLIGPVGIPAKLTSEFYKKLDEGQNPFWASTQQEYNELLSLALKNPPPVFRPLSDFLLTDYVKRQPTYKILWQQITDSQQRVLPIDLAKLAELSCGKFVIMGAEERTIHESILEVLRERVKDIGIHRCPASGHSVQCDQPKWLAHFIASEVIANP